MFTASEYQEYLKEIRAQVCSRCVERPPGGPPCFPLGKWCVIETNLSSLVEAVHEQSSPLMEPYLDSVHRRICTTCPLHRQEGCPCPGEYLMTLVVQAVETVDERSRGKAKAIPQN